MVSDDDDAFGREQRQRLTLKNARPFHDPELLPGVRFLLPKWWRSPRVLVIPARADLLRSSSSSSDGKAQERTQLLELELGLDLRLRPRQHGSNNNNNTNNNNVRIVGVEMQRSGRAAVVWLRLV